MTEFTESFSTIGANDAWHALAVNAAFPPALQNAFSALDAGTRAIATALRTSVAGLELARRVARTVDANPAEIALREALSEIDTFLAELAVNGGPTVHVLFVPLNRKKALPGTQVMAQSFRGTTVEFLRGAADQDAVGGRVLARGTQVGDDAHALGLQAEGEDFAGVFGAGLLEGADGRHVLSPFCSVSGPRPCGLDGDRQPGGDHWRSPPGDPDSTGGTFLPREEWRCPHRQGKKVVTTLLRRSGRGEDVLRADQPITRGRLDAGWDRRARRSRRP